MIGKTYGRQMILTKKTRQIASKYSRETKFDLLSKTDSARVGHYVDSVVMPYQAQFFHLTNTEDFLTGH